MTLQILSCPSPASAPKRPKARLRSERHGRDSLPRGRGQQPLLLSVSPFYLLLLGSSSSLTFAGLLFFFWLTLLSTIFARFSNFLTFVGFLVLFPFLLFNSIGVLPYFRFFSSRLRPCHSSFYFPLLSTFIPLTHIPFSLSRYFPFFSLSYFPSIVRQSPFHSSF